MSWIDDLIARTRLTMRDVVRSRRQLSVLSRTPETPYAFALLPARRPHANGFAVVTQAETIGLFPGPNGEEPGGLSVAMARALCPHRLYVWGSVLALLQPDSLTGDDHDLVASLELEIGIFPPFSRPEGHLALRATVRPDDLLLRPLIMTMVRRPTGWPQ